MSARDHSKIEELMAAAALGGLDPQDRQILDRELEAHAPCEGCRELESSFEATAGRLAFSLDPEPVDMTMVERILAEGGRVAVIPDVAVAPAAEPPPVVAMPDPVRYRDNTGRRGRRWAVIIGVAAVLGLAIVASLEYLPDLGRVSIHPTASQRFLRLAPPAGSTGQAQMTMAYTPGGAGVVLWGSNLPDPGSGKVYEVWMISGTTPVSGGCVQPTGGQVAAYLNASVGGASEMAVTAESSACPSKPTSAPVFTAALTA